MALVVGKGESRCASEHVGHENIRHPILSIFIWDGTLGAHATIARFGNQTQTVQLRLFRDDKRGWE